MRQLSLLVILVILYIYHPWFAIDKTLSSGDFPYIFLENIKEFSFVPDSSFLWLVPYYQSSAKILVEYAGLNWHFAEKILWFWPFLILSIFSSFYLTKSWIGVLIYTASTYPLMLTGGGQMGVAIAYSIAPFVLGIFMKIIDSINSTSEKNKHEKFILRQNSKLMISKIESSDIKNIVLASLLLAVQLMFDPRITYVTFLGIFLYFIIFFLTVNIKKTFLIRSFFFLIPIFTATLLNSFWIISILKFGFPKGLEEYSSLSGLKFLSFADFSNTISILHPNWPDNIFGKVGFMKSEFILLPIIAYSSLLFIKNKITKNIESFDKLKISVEQRRILFFAMLGLIGAFLAKGSNLPFNQINEILFQYFPGMSMFRDPTKFYLLTIISYSVLITFSIYSIHDWLKSKIKRNIPNLFFIFTCLYLIFLIRPAIMSELSGTFIPSNVPEEYVQLKNFLINQPDFFKTLWIPERQRFGFNSINHSSVNANGIFNTNSTAKVIKELKKEETYKLLQKAKVKYIIIPYDSKQEIFIKDRKYNHEEYLLLDKTLSSLNKLRKIPFFKQLSVFEFTQ